jgi:DNA-binding NarL/FixJ family response regulator
MRLFERGLVATLKQKDLEIVGEAADGKEACQLHDQLSPDVLVLDLRMPRKDALEVVIELMSSPRPKPQIIVMTTYEDKADVRRAFKAGPKVHLVTRVRQRPHRFEAIRDGNSKHARRREARPLKSGRTHRKTQRSRSGF